MCNSDPQVSKFRLFRYLLAMNREIELHKWYESERAGKDIGKERASLDWMIKHYRSFRDSFFKKEHLLN